MPDLKISQFENGGSVQPGDEIATNRAGVNTKVFAGSAAAADIGAGPDDISTNSTISENLVNTLQGTSTTSNSISIASKSFTTQGGKAFKVGATLLVTSNANPTVNRMTGIVTAYNSTTGELTVNVTNIGGSGTHTDWTIRVAGDVGAKGDKGDQGDTGATGATGDTGATGAAGANGTNGWTPELAIVADGERRVQQVVDWAGGSGTKPATGEYVGSTGLVTDIGDAVDLRGEPGEGAVSTVNDIGPDGLGNVELNADDIPYVNTTSGLSATDVQGAIDEVDNNVDTYNDNSHTWNKPQRAYSTSVSYTATVTLDFSQSNDFHIGALTGSITLANPTNVSVGQSGSILLVQDGSGGRNITWGTNWLFPNNGTHPALSSNPNSVDVLFYKVVSGPLILCSLNKRYA